MLPDAPAQPSSSQPPPPTLLELAQQALSSTRRGYDLLAPKFDATPFRTPEFVLRAAFARLSEAGPVDRGIDLCCGTGAALRHLRPLCRELAVGLDFSEGMLAEARRRAGQGTGTARQALVGGDMHAPPFRESFDLATTFGSLGHILPGQEARFVRAVHGLLRPGGRFVFVTAPPPPKASLRWLVSKGFNATMRVRNALWKPEFVMYYLMFLLPDARRLLEAEGFSVEVTGGLLAEADVPGGARMREQEPFGSLVLVTATRR